MKLTDDRKEKLLDLQVLLNLLQTPNLSQENLDSINKLITVEINKVFKETTD